MNQEPCTLIRRTIQEYAGMFSEFQKPDDFDSDDYWIQVEESLEHEMEWTREGATHIIALVRKYGTFVLRNALALASVMGIDDGELGY